MSVATDLVKGPHTRAALAGVPTVPVIPPGAELSPSTTVQQADLGKVPGVLTAHGWAGRGVSSFPVPVPEHTARTWDSWGASAGIPGARHPGLDVDISDETLARKFQEDVQAWFQGRGLIAFGARIPVRVGHWPKFVVPMVLTEPETGPEVEAVSRDVTFTEPDTGVTHGVQFIGAGKHYVAAGTHPKTGKPYRWEGLRGGAEDIFDDPRAMVRVSAQDLEDLFQMVLGWLDVHGLARGARVSASAGRAAVDPASLRAPSVAEVKALMSVMPNSQRVFPGRLDWIMVAQGLRGALPDDQDTARELFEDWSERYVDEDGNPLPQEKSPSVEFDKCRPSYLLGWPYLIRCGLRAGVDFQALGINPTGNDFLPLDKEDPKVLETFEKLAEDTAATAAPDIVIVGDEAEDPAGPAKGIRVINAGAREAIVRVLPPRPKLDPLGAYMRGTVSLTAGRGGAYKTALLLTEALALVTRKPLLGWRPYESGLRVLHLNLDESLDELDRRVAALSRYHGVPYAEFRDRLYLMGQESARHVRLTERTRGGAHRVRSEGIGLLERLVDQLGVDVLQIDPLTPAMPGGNDNDSVYELMLALGALASRKNISIMLATHMRKGVPGQHESLSQASDIRGASSLVDGPRYVRMMSRVSDTEAGKLGIPVTEAWRYVQVQTVKGNLVRCGEQWFARAETYDLGNGETFPPTATRDPRPGDEIGVLTPWQPATATVQVADKARVLKLLDDGPPSGGRYGMQRNITPCRSAVELLRTELGVTHAVAQGILRSWLDEGVLEERDTPRDKGGGAYKGLYVRPGAYLDVPSGGLSEG